MARSTITHATPPTPPSWTLGDRLAKARERAGISSGEMAGIIRVSRRTIVGWENDNHHPPYTAVVAYADITNTPLEWLETGSELGERPSDWNAASFDKAGKIEKPRAA